MAQYGGRLLDFIVRIYHDARSAECQILTRVVFHFVKLDIRETKNDITLNIPSLTRQRCLTSWGPRRTPWFFFVVISRTVWCCRLLKLCFLGFWNYNSVIQAFFFPGATTPIGGCTCILQPSSGLQPPRLRGFLITHNDAPHSVGLLWMNDKLVAETSTWQHTILKTDKYPCPGWDSNPQSQQSSGQRPTH